MREIKNKIIEKRKKVIKIATNTVIITFAPIKLQLIHFPLKMLLKWLVMVEFRLVLVKYTVVFEFELLTNLLRINIGKCRYLFERVK